MYTKGETAECDSPEPIQLVRELRETLGLFSGAMPISPEQAWKEALEEIRRLKGERQ